MFEYNKYLSTYVRCYLNCIKKNILYWVLSMLKLCVFFVIFQKPDWNLIGKDLLFERFENFVIRGERMVTIANIKSNVHKLDLSHKLNFLKEFWPYECQRKY